MRSIETRDELLARCVVCQGNIFASERYELWEGAYYCERHSVPYLRERAREYAALLHDRATLTSD